MATVALRATLIWRDEVMNDVVLERPDKITVGRAAAARSGEWLEWAALAMAVLGIPLAYFAGEWWIALAMFAAYVGTALRPRLSGEPPPLFIVPDLGLPKGFSIVRPGNRGYLLTLGERMRGTICLDGQEKDVAEFVRGADSVGGFAATPISGRDWGVVELDETGEFKLFFQFVPVEDAQPFFTPAVIKGGIGGYLGTIAALTAMQLLLGERTFLGFDLGQTDDIAEYAFRAFLAATALLAMVAIVAWIITKLEVEAQLAFIFSLILHTALIIATWHFYDPSDEFVWPGSRDLTAQYLATRIVTPPEEPKPKSVGAAAADGLAAPKTPDKPKVVKTKGLEGAAGGKGETPRATDKTNINNEAPAPPKVAIFEDRNRKVIDNIIDRNLSTNLSKFQGIAADETRSGSLGFGKGTGSGVGEGVGTGTTRGSTGKGAGGGGHAEGDYIANKGDVDTGGLRSGGGNCAHPPCGVRPKALSVSVGEAEGDIEGLTAEEINRVVKARAPTFRACYQRELNRSPGLAGKLVMHFVIGGDGLVKSAKTSGGSSMRNDAVEECVNRQIMNLHFPAKGGISNVNYPFVFNPGG